MTFSTELLRLLLEETTPHDDKGRAVVSGGLFQGATFEGDARFDRATFKGDARFDRATFKGDARFDRATFENDAGFDRSTFESDAGFSGARFKARGGFRQATFRGEAAFDEAIFESFALFIDATFDDDARFSQARLDGLTSFSDATFRSEAAFHSSRFQGIAGFYDARFEGHALFPKAKFETYCHFTGVTVCGHTEFSEAMFKGPVDLAGTAFEGPVYFIAAKFGDTVSFEQATFDRATQLGPMVVRKGLCLDGALFRERIRIEISAAILTCRRTRFLAGVQLRVRWAQVVLDDADLAAPSVLSGANPFPDLDEGDWSLVPETPWPVDPYGTPRLLSVRGADVAGLTVGAVDLQACRFVDAHHLDQLRAEGSNFPNTPQGWRWTKRRTIAEEHQWRASKDQEGWYGPESQPPDWLDLKELTSRQAGLLLPGEIAPLYRDLRKGLEDKKDEPGAADFYYGEMEMRRHDKRQEARLEFRNGGFGISAIAEWAILSVYWLISGYALRAWRALASLIALMLVASVLLAFWGFHEYGWRQFFTALPATFLFSIDASTTLLRAPDLSQITAFGEWLQIALRLTGPALLALVVLSLRGRVKR